MPMAALTLTADGRIPLPKEIQDSLGLRPGDRVDLRLRLDGVIELERERDDLMSLCGSIKPKVRGVSIDDMNEAIREAAGKP